MTIHLFLLMLIGITGREEVKPLDIVINEVLFNPVKDGFDYVEGYNRSADSINLQEIVIANRNSAGDISAEKRLSKEPFAIAPHSYFVITANEKWLRQHYVMPSDVIICPITSLPSFPDDEGTVILSDNYGTIIDELNYSNKWHFELIAETEGVSLERINYDLPTQDKNNWTSASSSPGFGTPGFQNSHFRSDLRVEGEVTIYPKLISPDNDGDNDFVTIHCKFSEPGYVANATIYDMSGRRVRYLLKNELLGTNSKFIWRGEDDQLNMAPSGIYILVTEIFNIQGKTRKFKNSIVVHSNLR